MRFQFKIRTMLVSCALFGLYISSYLNFREPICVIVRSAGGGTGEGYHEPNFQYGGGFAKFVFFPATAVDKICRPRSWSNYSTLDDVWTDQEYPWGAIHLCDGKPISLSLNAESKEDVENALKSIRSNRYITILTIRGGHFSDTHLEMLQQVRRFDLIQLYDTCVSIDATIAYQRTSPETEFQGKSITGEKYSR